MTKMNWLISIYIFTLPVISSVSSFSWSDCGPSTNPIKLQELFVKRKGDTFFVSLKITVAENITEPIEAKLDVKKKVPFIDYYIDIPCVDDMGSCDYKNICKLDPWNNNICPSDFVKNHVPCACPILQNKYAVKDFPVDLGQFIPELEGTYKVKLWLYKGGAELFCFKMKIKI